MREKKKIGAKEQGFYIYCCYAIAKPRTPPPSFG
jgi:hypothetical protein